MNNTLDEAKEIIASLLNLMNFDCLEIVGSERNAQIAKEQEIAAKFLNSQGVDFSLTKYIPFRGKMVEVPAGWEILRDGDEITNGCKYLNYRKYDWFDVSLNKDLRVWSPENFLPMIKKVK